LETLHKIDKVLFTQMIVTQMLSKHRILTQVAGHAMDVMKILPPLIIGEREIDMFVNALDDVLTECRKFPGRCGSLETISSKPRLDRGARPSRVRFQRSVGLLVLLVFR
jgi:hypothetical protein